MSFITATVRWSQVLLLTVFAAALWPLEALARRRALMGRGWVELSLAGEISELPKEESLQEQLVRRLTKRPEPKHVILARVRKLVDELIADRHARGMLVRLGALSGGWSTADSLRGELLRLRDAGKYVLVHVERGAGNMELLVASAASRLLVPPTSTLAAGGAAAPGLFFRGLLDRVGVTPEVLSAGRFKSAPDQFSRRDRSPADLEQTQAIVDRLDQALIAALQRGRGLDEGQARDLLAAAPTVGRRAKKLGFVDGLALDEDLVAAVRAADGIERAKSPMPAGTYLKLKRPPLPWKRVERHVGVVRVHGNIVDEPPSGLNGTAEVAAEKRVVADLRAALSDPSVGAVVLHVNTRGGSVTASDGIWSMVKRLDASKPVVACFSDVAASGGYYVACGARAIVASPLTVTGSIGVFAVVPTWPELTRRLEIGHDVVKNRKNADLYNPWSGFDDERRAHAQREVEEMYEAFLERVTAARGMSRDAADAVAQGRVWMGSDALDAKLVDGLGGLEEAVDRAKSFAGGKFTAEPRLVRARLPQSRPKPPPQEGAVSPAELARALVFGVPAIAAQVGDVLGRPGEARLLFELTQLCLDRGRGPRSFAWAPVLFE